MKILQNSLKLYVISITSYERIKIHGSGYYHFIKIITCIIFWHFCGEMSIPECTWRLLQALCIEITPSILRIWGLNPSLLFVEHLLPVELFL